MRRAIVLVAIVLGGCLPRFADRPIAWRDPDDAPIPLPRDRPIGDNTVRVRSGFVLPLERVLLIDQGEAQNVNALDEVPDSSWYADPRRAAAREGRPFRPADVAAAELPGPTPPFVCVQGKGNGASRGFVVIDAKGQKFILKLDAPGYFGLATATEVVAARLVRAAGWRTTSLTLLDIDRGDVSVSPKATYRDELGAKHPYTAAMLDQLFADVPRTAEGRYRVSAGRWIVGQAVGEFTYLGRRLDDPNDRVLLEDRRVLRGFYVFAEWINDIDAIDANNFDTYVGKKGEGHLLHYQQDVGGSFGNYATGPFEPWMGSQSWFDGGRILVEVLTLGARSTRPWDREDWAAARQRTIERWPELGWFDGEHFDPWLWRPLWPNPAFDRATARDRYWGTKRVLDFSPDEIRAAIAVGQYRPEAAERLFDVLWQRRDKIARAFLPGVAPFERVRFDGDRLCFDDLWEQAGFGDGRPARYLTRGAGAVTAGPGAERCAPLSRRSGYRVVALAVQRAGDKSHGPWLKVHFIEDGAGRRVVGLER